MPQLEKVEEGEREREEKGGAHSETDSVINQGSCIKLKKGTCFAIIVFYMGDRLERVHTPQYSVVVCC